MHDIFFHDKEFDFARKMIKEIDTDLIEEMAEIFKDYPKQRREELPLEDQERLDTLSTTQDYLNKILTDKQKIIDNLELLTCQQIHDLTLLIEMITQDNDFITVIFQELTKKRQLTNNGSGRIDFIVPRRTIAFDPNFTREEINRTLLNLQNARRNNLLTYTKKEIKDLLLEYSIPDIEREGNKITIAICETNDYSNNEYLLGLNEEANYDGLVNAYYTLEQLEKFSEKLAIFILKEKMKRSVKV